jgi:hypothetical protein
LLQAGFGEAGVLTVVGPYVWSPGGRVFDESMAPVLLEFDADRVAAVHRHREGQRNRIRRAGGAA